MNLNINYLITVFHMHLFSKIIITNCKIYFTYNIKILISINISLLSLIFKIDKILIYYFR